MTVDRVGSQAMELVNGSTATCDGATVDKSTCLQTRLQAVATTDGAQGWVCTGIAVFECAGIATNVACVENSHLLADELHHLVQPADGI